MLCMSVLETLAKYSACMHALYTHRKAVFITKSRNLFVIPRRDFPRAKGTLYGSIGECAHPRVSQLIY